MLDEFQREEALIHFQRGLNLERAHRVGEAVEEYRRAIAHYPHLREAHDALGFYYQRHGLLAKAAEEFRVVATLEDDFLSHFNLGCVLLELARYDEALASFSTALRLAPRPSAQAEVIEQICTIERYRELGAPRSAKDRLYAEHGVVYLGSAQDDGLRLEEFQDYHFTYPDIGTTLRRFVAVQHGLGWFFTCVVALDRQAGPLADALAHLLDIPQRCSDDIQPDDLPLLVLAVGREAELLKLAIERVPGEAMTFCLGLNWMRHSTLLPDVTGIVARGACSVPWEPELRRLRCDGAPPEQIAACQRNAAAQIVAATHDVPPDPNLARQVRYYRRHRHTRFADVFDTAPTVITA